MAGIRGKWPYRHGHLTKIRLPAFCGEKTTAMVAQFGYDQHRFEGYLGKVGLISRFSRMRFFCLPKTVLPSSQALRKLRICYYTDV